jgi:hypothetical protein
VWCIVLLQLPGIRCFRNNSSIYDYVTVRQNGSIPHRWDELVVVVKDSLAHESLLKRLVPNPGIAPSSYFVQQPVYVSLTTISERFHHVHKSIIRVIQGKLVPTHIYLCISEEPFLLDKGITSIPDNLLSLVAAKYLTIVYTQNIGPHRKLLPVLKRYWGQDVFIATVDDDLSNYHGHNLLYQLLKDHKMHRSEHLIALRARYIGFCRAFPHAVTTYTSWKVTKSYYQSEMLLLPTGTGGILYKPSYFHKIVFDRKLWELTQTADDITFRLATLINEVPIQLGCTRFIEGVTMHWNETRRRCKEDDVDRLFHKSFNHSSSNSIHIVDHDWAIDQLHLSSIPLNQSSVMVKSNTLAQRSDLQSTRRLRSNHTLKPAMDPNSLYNINLKGTNNACWAKAVEYLRSKKLLDQSKLFSSHMQERSKLCVQKKQQQQGGGGGGGGLAHHPDCSIYDCVHHKELIATTRG